MEMELFPETKVTAINKSSPAELVRDAINSGASLEKMEKLLELQERWELNESKKAYHKSMTAFKASPPVIEKDRKVSFGNTKYSHASLANVTDKINTELSKHGLSVSWKVSQSESTVSVTCKITHEQGHSEETTLMAPADSSGSKNPIQSIGSTISYLERYTILALTGLATSDMDDDAVTETEKISQEEADQVLKDLVNINADIPKFLKYMGIKVLSDMPKSDLIKAKAMIEAKKAVK